MAGIPGRSSEPHSSSAETDLLLACLRPGTGGSDQEIERLLERDLNWERIVRLALSHAVAPLLAARLGRLRSGWIPDDIRAALDVHLQSNRERNRELIRALLEIQDALGQRDILALPFKGPVLGAVAYGDFLLRRAGDLDLFVRTRDVTAACSVLETLRYREKSEFEIGRPMNAAEQAGYLRYQCEFAYFRSTDRILAEPHWAIVPKTFAVNVDCEEFWERAAAVSLGERSVATLAAEDLLVVLCIHSAKHEWTMLQWVCDVASLLECHPTLDLEGVLRRARAQGVERMVLLGLGLAQRTFGTVLPTAVQRKLDADIEAVELAATLGDRLLAPGLPTSPVYEISRLRLAMRERWIDRAAYVLRTLVTPTEKHLRMVALPEGVHGLYVPLKLVHDYVALPIWHLGRRATNGSTDA